jgi:archaetidylinositol phosphate synthase
LVSSKFKERFEELVARGVTPLASLGVTPNTLTFLGLVASIGSAWSYMNWSANRSALLAASALLLISGLIDAIDGVLARKIGATTMFGGFFDSVSDRYSDAVVLSSIILAGLCHPAWGLAAIVGSLMVSYARSRAEATGVKMAAVGLAERAERMTFLALVTAWAYFRLEMLAWGVIILAVLAHVTVLQRAAHFYSRTRGD